MELTGLPENLDLAESTYHYLLQAGEVLWRCHREKHQLSGSGKRNAFLIDLFLGLSGHGSLPSSDENLSKR